MTPEATAIDAARAVLGAKSKSFALAAGLLPASCRDAIAVVYAWCRHVDDAIDLAPRAERARALARLRRELDAVYAAASTGDPVLDAFGAVARGAGIPRAYPEELLAGMAMDVERTRYRTLDDLLLYCHRVAGVVGLMLCHVMGVSDERALRRAAHLGIAMQLTNICRDVEEDLQDGRVYLPGAPPERREMVRQVGALLDEADRYYRSADRGLIALSFRCALAVRAARLVYAAIGARLRRRANDPFGGRAWVPAWYKLLLVIQALVWSLAELPRRLARRARPRPPQRVLGYPHDVVPI